MSKVLKELSEDRQELGTNKDGSLQSALPFRGMKRCSGLILRFCGLHYLNLSIDSVIFSINSKMRVVILLSW